MVLTDMHMPEMDGFTLVEKMRSKPELSPVTVMMLTSAGHREDVDRCRDWEFCPIFTSQFGNGSCCQRS